MWHSLSSLVTVAQALGEVTFTFWHSGHLPMHLHQPIDCAIRAFKAPETEFTCQRCRRRTRRQLPFCYEHARSILHVDIRPSTIPGAGLGLFAPCADG